LSATTNETVKPKRNSLEDFRIVEWFLWLPYRLPSRTKAQRIFYVLLVVPVFLFSTVGLLLAFPFIGVLALVRWIKEGDTK
jgi:uncharacterized protein involved in cysteine biosynthesis